MAGPVHVYTGERVPRKPTRREQLFNEAVQRERAATRKINRIQQANGAKIKGTSFDPRTNDKNLLRTMNGRELRSHINKLNKFVNRKTQFVAGLQGAPVPKNRADYLERLQKQFNKKAELHEALRNEIVLPGQSGTIGSRNRDMTPKDPARANMNHRTMQPVNRAISDVTGAKSVEKLIKNLKDKNSRNYLAKSLEARMNSAKALLKGAGYEDLIVHLTGGTTQDEEGNDVEIQPMSMAQLDLLLNYSTFGDTAADRFASGTDEEAQRDEQDRDYELRNGDGSREADIRAQLLRIFDWARTTRVPRELPQKPDEPTPPSKPNRKPKR